MVTYTIDTHETVRQFVAAGIPDKQAEAIVAAISRVDSEVVTKADLKQEIAAVRADLKQEIAAVRADLKQEIAAVRADLDVLRSDIKAEISTAINKICSLKSPSPGCCSPPSSYFRIPVWEAAIHY